MTISRNLSILAASANASGVLNVASGGTGLTTFTAANNALYSTSASALAAGTLPVLAGGTGMTTAPAALTNLLGWTTTVTSATLVTLTSASTTQQHFTGSTAQNVNLPDTSTLAVGWTFEIYSFTSSTIAVRTSTAASIYTIPTGMTFKFVCQSTAGNTAAAWLAYPIANGWTGSGNMVLATSPTLVSPLLGTPTSGVLTNCTGYTTTNLSGTVNLTTQVTGTLPIGNGGTGQSSYAVGDLLYASTTTDLSKLADVATGNALISGGVGVAPSYGKIGLTTHVSGTLAVGNGGTGATTLTSNGVLYGNGTSAAGITAAGTTGQVLIATTSGAPSWGSVPTTAAVTSITFGSTGLTPATATTGAVTVAGTLAVTNGGTGITSFGTGVATWLGTPTSANLAAVVTDETGSGALVFATSPTLVTPALGTPSSGVVTNLTGTASININGTVGATTPATGTFTTLSDSIGEVRTIVQNAQSGAGSYTLVATDSGKHIYVTGTGGVTMPVNIFTVGQAITIVNNTAASITITAPSAGTMYLAGTATTGNRTLAQRGIATVLFVVGGATPTIIASGAGLT